MTQANAYGWSVLGMLAMPYLLAGSIGVAIWRASKARPPSPVEIPGPDSSGVGAPDASPPPPPLAP